MDSSNTPPHGATAITAVDCTAAPASLEKSTRGPAFTNAKDQIVARAFIAASENAICNTHQKGKEFKLHMFALYKDLINKQNRANRTLTEQSSNATRDEYLKQGVAVSLCYRSAESVFNSFTQISDLAGAFWTKCEVDRLRKRPSTIGKKKARQAKADANKLVKAIISEVVVKKEQKVNGNSVVLAYKSSGECRGVNNKIEAGAGAISSVIAQVGMAPLENMKAKQDMRLVQSRDTPDRKLYAKEQLALRWAETREKRQALY
ncbi:hypothetical protein MHU86_3103 [Fragilaria crotonensis]|nr:hypothetical protein MHU86_3103 [Fragilaria crotonensis]